MLDGAAGLLRGLGGFVLRGVLRPEYGDLLEAHGSPICFLCCSLSDCHTRDVSHAD